MNYNIISSGSTGNATVIETHILIDCGVSFSKLKPFYKELKLVLLTHIHQDHFNKTTIKRLAKERPTLRFGSCEWLVNDLVQCGVKKSNIDVYQANRSYDYRAFKIQPIDLYHDVPNVGYKVFIGNKKVIYATDTNKIEHIEAKDYDLYLVEGNYEEKEIESRIKEKVEAGEYVYEYRVKDTHLTKEQTTEWLLKNMGNNSKYEFMHEHIERGEANE